MNDQQALERYRYMLRTAPPDDIERAHEEAFAQLSPEQRTMVLRELSQHVPPSEVGGDDPKIPCANGDQGRDASAGNDRADLRRSRQPGPWLDVPGNPGGRLVGSAIADAFFDNDAASDSGSEADDTANRETCDAGDDMGGGDLGGDAGDFGGDFGGGDFGI